MSEAYFIREATVEDVDILSPSHLSPESKDNLRKVVSERTAVAYTLLAPKGDVLAIVGGYFMYSSVMELWAFVGDTIKQNSFHYAKFIKWFVSKVWEEWNLTRMQFTVRTHEPWGERWIRFLGFKIEVCMKNYGEDNAPYYLASKTESV